MQPSTTQGRNLRLTLLPLSWVIAGLDTPLFFVPMMILCFILWAFAIDALWNWKKKRAEAITRA